MARRSSTLTNTNIAIQREIDSRYDIIKYVGQHLESLIILAGLDLETFAADIAEATNFTGITVEAGIEGSWDAENKILTVPTVPAKSMYQIAVEHGYIGSESEFNRTIWLFADLNDILDELRDLNQSTIEARTMAWLKANDAEEASVLAEGYRDESATLLQEIKDEVVAKFDGGAPSSVYAIDDNSYDFGGV